MGQCRLESSFTSEGVPVNLSGILVVDKPKGLTSFDVVRQVRRALKGLKTGHTGTLDPMATGVLPLCLGEATKIAQFIIESDKTYEATIRLGSETDTYDAEGSIIREAPVPHLTRELIEQIFSKFTGPLAQIPPMYSAIKVDGKRLYELARAGQEIVREPRDVVVHRLELRDFNATDICFCVKSSKGFFVRSLAFDLGRALGSAAHLASLRRTQSGPFALKDAITLEKLLADPLAAGLVSVDTALISMPEIRVDSTQEKRVRCGGLVEVSPTLEGVFRIVSDAGELLAIAEPKEGKLKFRRVLVSGS
jgi:tRNA pseudouridine55 synthase